MHAEKSMHKGKNLKVNIKFANQTRLLFVNFGELMFI